MWRGDLMTHYKEKGAFQSAKDVTTTVTTRAFNIVKVAEKNIFSVTPGDAIFVANLILLEFFSRKSSKFVFFKLCCLTRFNNFV